MKRLVLIGGGHAHLFVLRQLAQSQHRDLEVIFINPSIWQHYSGMLPGWMAGHYRSEDCRIDLRPLAAAAGARFVGKPIIGMDANRRCVGLSDGRHVEYDLLSLDVGSETDVDWLADLGDLLLPVKPLEEFQSTWTQVLAEAKSQQDFRLLVVGGGAAGVELVLAAQYAFKQTGVMGNVTLITGESGLLAGHTLSVRRRTARALQKAGVVVVSQRAVGTGDGVLLGDGQRLVANRVIATTGARAPVWLTLSGLALDAHGYVAVDACHRSRSHLEVFAAGDVCARSDVLLARSGVQAVRVGPVLAYNLSATLDGHALHSYRPCRYSLYLLTCGDRYAIASWGPWSAEGRWVWQWKDRIDRRFIRFFAAATGAAACAEEKQS